MSTPTPVSRVHSHICVVSTRSHMYCPRPLTHVLYPLAHSCVSCPLVHTCPKFTHAPVSRVLCLLTHLCDVSTHLCPLAHTCPFFTCAPVLRVLCLLAHLCDVATRSHLSRVLHSHTCVPCPLTHLSWSGTPGSQSPLHSSGRWQRPEEWSFVARIILSKAGTWWCGLYCPSSCPPSPACLGLGASVAAPGPPAGAPPTLG